MSATTASATAARPASALSATRPRPLSSQQPFLPAADCPVTHKKKRTTPSGASTTTATPSPPPPPPRRPTAPPATTSPAPSRSPPHRRPSATPTTARNSSCPEPRGATFAKPNGTGPQTSEVHIEAEVPLAAPRGRAGEVLSTLRDGRASSVNTSSSSFSEDDDRSHPFPDPTPTGDPAVTPYIYDCTLPAAIPDAALTLPSPTSSPPPYRSPLLRPVPMSRATSAPSPFASPAGSAPSSPPTARSSPPSPGQCESTRASERTSAPPTLELELQHPRPALHTYTSFEHTFALLPPPSPPPSPGPGTRKKGDSWWAR